MLWEFILCGKNFNFDGSWGQVYRHCDRIITVLYEYGDKEADNKFLLSFREKTKAKYFQHLEEKNELRFL